MRAPSAILCLALALTAPVAARDVPPAVPAGKPQTCIPLGTIHESVVRSDRIIDFRTARNRYYRVTLPQACPGLGFERRFAYATSIGQLCAQDIITFLYQTGAPGGTRCGLAPFQPVTIALPAKSR